MSARTSRKRLGENRVSKVRSLFSSRRASFHALVRGISLRVLISCYSSGCCVPRAVPKPQIVACLRFVEELQRRRTRVVEARKRRWAGRVQGDQGRLSDCFYTDIRSIGINRCCIQTTVVVSCHPFHSLTLEHDGTVQRQSVRLPKTVPTPTTAPGRCFTRSPSYFLLSLPRWVAERRRRTRSECCYK